MIQQSCELGEMAIIIARDASLGKNGKPRYEPDCIQSQFLEEFINITEFTSLKKNKTVKTGRKQTTVG